jgi:hypothetical protein
LRALLWGNAGGASKLEFSGWEAKILLHVGIKLRQRHIGQEREGKGGFSWNQRDDTVSSWWDLKDEPSRGRRRDEDQER